MAYTTNLGGYVKFLRGTESQWAVLTTAEKDADTLYFISEPKGTTGKLYLGSKLIAGGDTSTTTIKDLQDILLSEGIADGSFLVYDKESEKWVDKPAAEVLATVVKSMKGATAEADGEAGLVPVPTRGQQNLFLRGDATWADPTTELKGIVTTLVGDDADTSVREIAKSEVQKIVGTAPEALDTLEEIATWITNHESTVNLLDLGNRVTNLDNIVSKGIPGDDGQIKTPSLVAQVGDLNTDLAKLNETVYGTEDHPENGLVTITTNLSDSLSLLNQTVTKHTSDIKDMQDRLRWQDIVIAD